MIRLISLALLCGLFACGDDGREEVDAPAADMTADVAGDMLADVPAADVAEDMAADVAEDMVAEDMAADVAEDMAADVAEDVAADVAEDMAADVAEDMAADVAEDIPTEDMAVEDMASDMTYTYEDIQCRVSSDCSGPSASCSMGAPGGVCSGCAEGTCPGDTECMTGYCLHLCSESDPCPLGYECLGSGRCAISMCEASDDCPGGYVCRDGGRCGRPSCADGCPAGWACQSGTCVEP